MEKQDSIFVAGHNGMVGSAVLRLLVKQGFTSLLTRSRHELDLRDQRQVADFFMHEKPAYVILSAARVGGIRENTRFPADFLYDNLMIQSNVIHQSYLSGVRKLCFLGSSCVYPRDCEQPIRETHLLDGPLEPTNEGYAIAKIAGYKLAYYYAKQHGMNTISLMPCNLYGTNDDFNLETGHVLSALVRRFCDAVDEKLDHVTLWGTGAAYREFLHVDDCAEAVLFLMENLESPDHINVGSGADITIRDLAERIATEAGFRGTIEWDPSKPDGMPRKCVDVSRIRSLGFIPKITLEDGIRRTIAEYRERKKSEPSPDTP